MGGRIESEDPAVLNQKPRLVWIGNGGGFRLESMAVLLRNTQLRRSEHDLGLSANVGAALTGIKLRDDAENSDERRAACFTALSIEHQAVVGRSS